MKINKELITQYDPKKPVSEAFRTLRTNIQFMGTAKKMKSVLITSTSPGEGKSYTAANLAITFAQAGNKVILIDADMRKGRLHKIFGVSPVPGLSDYLYGVTLEGKEKRFLSQFVKQVSIDNLTIMPTGSIPPNPSELLNSDQMKNLLKDLKDKFDIIIIDGTPCELVSDSIILSTIVDSTIIVASYKETKKENLGRIVKNIQSVNGHLAGIVMNKFPIPKKKYGSSYYYYGKENYNNKNTSLSHNYDFQFDSVDIDLDKEYENKYGNENINENINQDINDGVNKDPNLDVNNGENENTNIDDDINVNVYENDNKNISENINENDNNNNSNYNNNASNINYGDNTNYNGNISYNDNTSYGDNINYNNNISYNNMNYNNYGYNANLGENDNNGFSN